MKRMVFEVQECLLYAIDLILNNQTEGSAHRGNTNYSGYSIYF